MWLLPSSVDEHVAVAAAMFQVHQWPLWRCCDMKLAVKLWGHRTMVIPTLLYDSEMGSGEG